MNVDPNTLAAASVLAGGETRVPGQSALRGIALMCAAAFTFAVMAAVIKSISPRFDAAQVVFARGLVGWLLLRGIFVLRGKPAPKANDRPRLVIRAFFGFAGLGTYTWAIQHIELGLASALNQTSPLFVLLIAVLFLHERPRALSYALVASTFVGIALVISPDLGRIEPAALVGLSSGLFAGIAYTLVRQLRHTDAAETVVLYFCWYSMVFALPLLPFSTWVTPSAAELLALLAIGAFGMLGQELLTYAYHGTEATVVSPFLYVTTLSGLGFGWLFWGEWPSDVALLGAAIAIVSMIALAFSRRGPTLRKPET